MQDQSKLEKETFQLSSEDILKLFRFFIQYRKENQFRIIPLAKITVMSWMHDKKLLSKLEKLAAFIFKNNFNACSYAKWLALTKKAKADPNQIVNPDNLREYFKTYVKEQADLKKVYDKYVVSCKYVSSLCIKAGFHSASEIIKVLFSNGMVASLLVSGKISPYFLASFTNIKALCKSMDPVSKGTLAQVISLSEVLRERVQQSYMEFKKCKADTVAIIDSLIWKWYNNPEKETSEQQ